MKKRILSALLALLLAVSLLMTAFAAEWNIADGDISVNAGSSGQTVTQGTNVDIPDDAPVIKGSSTTNTVTITAAANQTAEVTLKEVNINVSGTGGSINRGAAAVSTSGEGNVIIELDGENTVRSGWYRAGVAKNNDGELTITAADDNGSLDAHGGISGAGIGGDSGSDNSVSNITLSGGKIKAMGGDHGAGIGGGGRGSGSNITVSGGAQVTAQGGLRGAGIGGGLGGSGSNITVSGDAQLKVQGGNPNNYYGAGAPIGNGGDQDNNRPVNGAEVKPDVSELTAKGKIEYYAPGADMENGNPTITIYGCDHEWDAGVETKAPTCTKTGVKTYTCTKDASHTKDVELPVKTHEFKDYFPDGNASCDEDGTKTAKCVWYDQCGKEDTLPNEGGRLNHSFEGQEYVPDGNASCESDGSKTAKCVRYGIGGCTATDTLPDEGSRLPHTVVTDEAVAPTYTHTGLTEGSHCSVCEEVLKAQKVVPTLPLYRVTDEDGRDIRCKAERKNGVLTVTVDADYAILTGELRGVRALKAQGVERIEFITNSAISAFAPADLLTKGDRGETYHLTHNGETITFTLGAKKTDVSDILEGA